MKQRVTLDASSTLTRSAPDPAMSGEIADMDGEAQLACFVNNRRYLANDPYRPLYHFSPPGFGTHDPAGLCWWQGHYHLFYLLSVPGVRWGRGHAVSEDLVHWRDLPMLPKEINGGTGQIWVEPDRVILGIAKKMVVTASDPMLQNWTVHSSNSGSGDNYIWRDGEFYYLTSNDWGQVRTTNLSLMRSKDAIHWQPVSSYFEDGYFTDPVTDCSCNNVLPLGNGKHLILFFSHNQGPKYYIGKSDLAEGRFTIEKHGRMNYGPVMRGSLHAPSGFVDPTGRCIGMWNVFECRMQETFMGDNGGLMSLPRRLSLNEKNTAVPDHFYPELNPLCIEPIEELRALRFNPVELGNISIPANGETILEGVQGRVMQMEAVIDPRNAREVGLRVLRSPGGEEQTTISLSMQAWAWPWQSDKRELMIDVSQASLSPEVASRTPEVGPLYLQAGELLRLQVFIDRSIIEVFANGRQCLTLRAYPTRHDSTGVSVFARGSEASLISLVGYQIRSIWPELKEDEGQ